MKVYFTSSTRPEAHRKLCKDIITELQELGHIVKRDLMYEKAFQVEAGSEDEQKIIDYHRKMITYKRQSDLVVVEASHPSISLGQEISFSLANNIPVIVLYLRGKKPSILRAIGTDYLHLVEYTPETLKKILSEYVEYAGEVGDNRFNFFVSSEIETFLNWISNKRRIPRAVFLRQLIEEDMRRNKKYLGSIGEK